MTGAVKIRTTGQTGPVLLNPGGDETALLFTLMSSEMYEMNIV